jgi:hypothetical protein
MQMNRIAGLALALALAAPARQAQAGELRGSLASMQHQFKVARDQGVSLLGTPAEVREQVATHQLEPVVANADFALHDVSYPFARPELNVFIERLAAQYYAATGEQLVVTSLTRPISTQPRNAHPLSVHPTGLAVDFRVPALATQRSWLEATLLSLEDKGVLDVTRERNPPHYHVAVFPKLYRTYVDARVASEGKVAAARTQDGTAPTPKSVDNTGALPDVRGLLFSALGGAVAGLCAIIAHQLRRAWIGRTTG